VITLTPEEAAAGFARPLRTRVLHTCGAQSSMQLAQAEDMARDPKSWSTCWCMVCGRRLPIEQFTWAADGQTIGT
jgi:hypothetical protein